MKRWTTADGLPHNSISALLQTRDGYVWIGTANGGLVRFDGVTFKTFDLLNTPGLASDGIGALYEDARGTLWIGTKAGLVRYQDGAFTPEHLGDDVPHNIIYDIRADREGRLWVAAHGQVVRRDGDGWTVIPAGAGSVRLSASSDGTMWIGTSTGLIEWRDRIVRTLTTRDGLPSDFVLALHEDRDGRLWIGTNRGLAHLTRRGELPVVERTILSDVAIHAVFEDSGGGLWFGAAGRLFTRAAGGPVIESNLSNGAHTASIRTTVFTEDRERHVWFGQDGRGGLYRLAPERVSTRGQADGLPCENVGAISQAPDGTIWVATHCDDGRGLVAIRDGALTEYSGVRYVESLLAEPDGVLWVGTFEGRLFRVDPSALRQAQGRPEQGRGTGSSEASHAQSRSDSSRFQEVPSPTREGRAIADSIAVLYRHDDGALWLGTSRGLLRFQDGEWTRLRASDGLVSDDVRSIVRGGDGSVWIGTDAGVSRYHDGRFTNYRAADGVPPGPVRAIHVDVDEVVWLGTYGGGLARFKDGKFTRYGVRGGVLDSSVHRILEDDEGSLWLAGDRGIRRASKRDLNAIADGGAVSLTVRLFDERDGMRSMECNGMAQPAGWRMRDGTFHFPTQRGVVRIDPARVRQSALPAPLPHIEDVMVDSTPAAAGPEVIAQPGYREVEIHYTAPTFMRPEYTQFRYRLDWTDAWTAMRPLTRILYSLYDRIAVPARGARQEKQAPSQGAPPAGISAESVGWVEAGTRRVASYSNLRPGQYRFLVTARHSGGPWQEQAAAIAVVLQPHLYQRVPFQIALALLIATGTVALGRQYVKRLHHRAAQLEAAVAERTVDLSAAHESLAKAKRAAEEAHGQVLAVLNQLDIGVLVLNPSGTVRYASASAQRILGKGGEALVGRPWALCLPLIETDRAQLKARIGALSLAGTRLPVQIVLGGKRYWMEIDVQDEPPPGDGRILYIYNVTEVSTLPAGPRADGPHGLVGRSTPMLLLYKQVRDVARVDTTVLIEGETGAGKELVARAIHRGSRRAEKPFVAINAAGLAESLLASQLFGHRRGAFTGAIADQMGVFEAADGGTLFLDEIGDMPLSLQASLLRVLQEREITRIGDSHARRVDVRFLAATHRDLTKEVLEGRFREDLLYRVRIATIAIPPLRERLDDVPLLVDAFLTQAAKQAGRAVPEISRDAVDALMRHRWPGNVRELRGVIEQCLLRAPGEIIRLEDLPPEILSGREHSVVTPAIVAAAGRERERLVEALRRTGGNRTEAARLLGIGRSTLYRRLAEHGLDTDPQT